MHCMICDSVNTETLLNQKSYPYFTVPVSKQNKREILGHYAKSKLSSPLIIKICNDCGHSHLATLPDLNIVNDLYSKYYSYPSPLKGDFYPERDNDFLNYFDKNIMPFCKDKGLTSILEIGCYDGYVLHHLQKKKFDVTGCDPSEGAEIGKKYGVNIIKEFFDAERFNETNLKYDVVISRHFIEHVVDPKEWINGLNKILNKNGILIIETPNIQFYLEQGLPSVFSLQHLHGFSAVSLHRLLSITGMKVLDMEASSSNLITVTMKGSDQQNINHDSFRSVVSCFNKEIINNKNKVKQFLSKHISDESNIGIWGAGGLGITCFLLYDIPFQYIDFFIDSDSQKWNMEYLNYVIPIISPEKAKQAEPDLVIVASMYNKSIQKQIKTNKMSCSVLSLFPEISYSTPISDH